MREAYLKRRANLLRFFAARLGSKAAAEKLVRDILVKMPTLRTAAGVQDPAVELYQIGADLLAQRRAPRDLIAISGEPAPETGDGRLEQLAAAVEALPPLMQQAFRLHKLEGWTIAETAQAMGASEREVEKYIGGALKALLAGLT
ncbi:MAG: sigma factor-like helix-turn-helix DNA-binding protein [Caulobacteraceae bacterium]